MTEVVGEALVELRGDKSKLVTDMRKAGADAGQESGRRFHRGFTSATAKLGAAVGVTAVAGFIGKTVQLEAQYSKTLNVLQATTDAGSQEMKDLGDLAQEMGAKTVFSAKDAADAMLELARGGISPAAIEAGALKSAMTLAAAGELDMGTAANTVVQAMGAFGLKAKDAGSAAAALSGGANASSASVADMAQALSQAGTGAAAAGLTIQETTAALAAFSNAGIQGSDAGTSLKTFLTRLVPATDKASSAMENLGLMSFDATAAAKALTKEGIALPKSMNYDEVRKAAAAHFARALGIKADSKAAKSAADNFLQAGHAMDSAFTDKKGNFEDLATISGALKKSLKGLSDEQRTAALTTIFGSDAIRAANVLSKQGTKGIEKLTKATSDQGAAQKQADANMKGTAGALESFKGSVETAMLQLGLFAQPAVIGSLSVLTDAVNGIKPAFEGIAASVGPVIEQIMAGFSAGGDGGGIASLVSSFEAVRTAALPVIDQLVAGAQKLAPVFGSFAAAIATNALPVVQAIADQFSTNVLPAIRELIPAVVPVIAAIVGGVKQFLPVVSDLAQKLVGVLGPGIKSIADKFSKDFLPAIQKLIPILVPIGKVLLKVFGEAVIGVIRGAIQAIQGIIDVVSGVVNVVVGLLTGDWSRAWKGLGQIVSGAVNAILGLLRVWWNFGVLSIFRKGAKFLLEGIWKKLWTGLKDGVQAGMKLIRDLIGKGLTFVRDLFVRGVKAYVGLWRNLFGFLRDILVNGIKVMRSAFGGFAAGVKTILFNLWTGAKALVGRLVTGLVSAVKSIPGKVLALGRRFLDTGRELIGKFISGIAGGAGKAAGLVKSIAGNVWQALRSLLNSAIGKINAALEFKIKLPGPDITINPPNIPKLARGTDWWSGGPVVVNDGGPELINLPRGSSVTPAGRSKRMMEQSASAATGTYVHIERMMPHNYDDFTGRIGDARRRAFYGGPRPVLTGRGA